MKKDPGRFTIRFNMADPNHKKAVECISRQGPHSKATYIVNAILFYEASMAQLKQMADKNTESGAPTISARPVSGSSAAKPKTESAPEKPNDPQIDAAIKRTMATFQTLSA